jgi:hypothetical protein
MNLGWRNQVSDLVREDLVKGLAEDLGVATFEEGLAALMFLQQRVAELKVEQIWPYYRPKEV